MKTYQIANGTSYDSRTLDEVIQVLETARLNRTRLHICLGETDDDRGNIGLDWLEEFETHGYIGRSIGPVKVPLLIANRRSFGGGAILDHCIVRIRTSAGDRVLYQHPNYHHAKIEIRQKLEPVSLSDGRMLTVDVLRDGTTHASFESIAKVRRWIRKMGIIASIVA